MTERAHINPEILKWARESARISTEAAAKKVNVSVEKIVQWESGEVQPTVKQAQKLAEFYKRPFAILFLPEIPKDFQPLKDFRTKDSLELSTASVFIIREIQQKQAWIADLIQENQEEKLSFVGKYNKKSNPVEVAQDILDTLDIDPLNYTHDNPILEWIQKAEKAGIFISRTSFIHTRLKLNKEELQGFAIADEYAPFVFINTDDWNAPQLFTLVHELAHLWIAETGISNNISIEIDKIDKYNLVEIFCNEVAANALMPAPYMLKFNKNQLTDSKELFKISKKIGVSSFAFLVRALKINLIDLTIYNNMKIKAQKDFELYLKKEERKKQKAKENNNYRPDYYLLKVNRNSKLFTHRILEAYHGGYIEPSIASSLLNIKLNNFTKLEGQLYK